MEPRKANAMGHGPKMLSAQSDTVRDSVAPQPSARSLDTARQPCRTLESSASQVQPPARYWRRRSQRAARLQRWLLGRGRWSREHTAKRGGSWLTPSNNSIGLRLLIDW